eukprot:1161587-Pelagomonas_calceolata.AAC.6
MAGREGGGERRAGVSDTPPLACEAVMPAERESIAPRLPVGSPIWMPPSDASTCSVLLLRCAVAVGRQAAASAYFRRRCCIKLPSLPSSLLPVLLCCRSCRPPSLPSLTPCSWPCSPSRCCCCCCNGCVECCARPSPSTPTCSSTVSKGTSRHSGAESPKLRPRAGP